MLWQGGGFIWISGCIYRYTSPVCFASKSFATSGIICFNHRNRPTSGSIALKCVLLGWKALLVHGILGVRRRILRSADCAAFHLDGMSILMGVGLALGKVVAAALAKKLLEAWLSIP